LARAPPAALSCLVDQQPEFYAVDKSQPRGFDDVGRRADGAPARILVLRIPEDPCRCFGCPFAVEDADIVVDEMKCLELVKCLPVGSRGGGLYRRFLPVRRDGPSVTIQVAAPRLVRMPVSFSCSRSFLSPTKSRPRSGGGYKVRVPSRGSAVRHIHLGNLDGERPASVDFVHSLIPWYRRYPVS